MMVNNCAMLREIGTISGVSGSFSWNDLFHLLFFCEKFVSSN